MPKFHGYHMHGKVVHYEADGCEMGWIEWLIAVFRKFILHQPNKEDW